MAEVTSPVDPAEEVTGTPLVTDEMMEEELIGSIPGLPTRAELEAANAEKKVEDEEETPPEPTTVVEASAPVVEILPPNPGEFTPSDYSFQITTYDEDGNKPKTVTVKSLEQWDELLEAEPNFATPAALLKANRAATKMEAGLAREEAEHQKEADLYEAAVESLEARQAESTAWQSEFNYLVAKGELPPIAKELVDADWNDPEIAKSPGVKEQVELLNYMVKESELRSKAGLGRMTSVIDAWNAFKVEKSAATAKDTKAAAATARKAAASKVAPTNSAPVSAAPKGIAVGRGGSLRDLDTFF